MCSEIEQTGVTLRCLLKGSDNWEGGKEKSAGSGTFDRVKREMKAANVGT